jgi:hypothetical protein
MFSIEKPVGDTVSTHSPALETSDIQATVLRPRPSPYCGEYVILRIGDAAQGTGDAASHPSSRRAG